MKYCHYIPRFFYEAFQDTFEESRANKSCMNRVIPVMQYLLNFLIKKKKKMNMHALKTFISIEGYRRLSEILSGHALLII